MSQGVYVLGGKCPGGKCPGGKCPGGICPRGKCPGVHVWGGYVLEPCQTPRRFKFSCNYSGIGSDGSIHIYIYIYIYVTCSAIWGLLDKMKI